MATKVYIGGGAVDCCYGSVQKARAHDKNPFFVPGAVIKLWDMRKYPTEKIVMVLARIAAVKDCVIHHRAIRDNYSTDERDHLRAGIREALPVIDELGIVSAKALCQDLHNGLYRGMNLDHIESATNSIRIVIEAELKSRNLFAINPEHIRYYDNDALAGPKFRDNWPKANDELREAGNCFALDRHTACACHLMRATEYALRSFEGALKITAQPRDNWGNILNGIEQKRGRKGDSRPGHPAVAPIAASAGWNAKPEFFEGCYTYINSVKTSCRDKVFHVEAKYDQPQAERLFQSVVAFLSHAAEELNELP